MKHRKLCIAILLCAVMIFGTAGCSNTQDTDAKTQTESKEEQKDTEQEKKENPDKEVKKEDPQTDKKENAETKEETGTQDGEKEAVKSDADVQESQEESVPVQTGQAFIYVPDENAEGWDVNQVEIPQVSADALIGQLVGAGVLTDSITVQNFEETEEEGQYVLKLICPQILKTVYVLWGPQARSSPSALLSIHFWIPIRQKRSRLQWTAAHWKQATRYMKDL